MELDSFEGVSVYTKASCKIPQDPMDKQALFDWMQEKGIYDAYRTVNSQSLNSLVKHEYDLAKERGEFDFKIPGLEIQQQTILSVRKK
jgi:trans-2-enoyl-CoA reductase